MLKGLGTFISIDFDLPIKKRAELIKNAGFDSVFFWLGDEEIEVRNGNKNHIPNIIRDSGLVLDSVHLPFSQCNDMWSENENIRNLYLTSVIDNLDFLNKHSIEKAVIHGVRGSFHGEPNTPGIETFRKIIEEADIRNINIVLENTSRTNFFELLFNEIDSDNLKFCYDCGHDYLFSSNPGAILKKYKNKLVCTHFSDNNGKEDNHYLPGHGVIDYKIMAEVFPKDVYDGYITIESFPIDKSKTTPELFVKDLFKSAEFIRDLIY